MLYWCCIGFIDGLQFIVTVSVWFWFFLRICTSAIQIHLLSSFIENNLPMHELFKNILSSYFFIQKKEKQN